MRKLIGAFLSFGLVLLASSTFAQSGTCADAVQFCGGASPYTYPASTNTTAPVGPNYGCLGSEPNPAFFYMQIANSGNIDITINNSNSVDVDFILWGPFTSLSDGCNSGLTGSAVDCSYSSAAIENVNIPNAVAGEVYILLITNYSGQPTNISFSQTGGTGSTTCVPPCSLSPGPSKTICQGTSALLTVAGSTDFTWSPATGLNTTTGDSVIASPSVTTVYTVTGVGSCVATAQITVTVVPLDAPTLTIADATCVCDGFVTATPSATGIGVGPYSYTWTSGGMAQTESNLCPGGYSVTVTDVNGCNVTVPFSINVTGGPVSSVTTQSVLCNGGSTGTAIVTPTSGTAPYSYSWSNGDQDSVATGLTAGNYDILITDINGCQSLSTATVTQPDPLVITPSQVDVMCKGGTDGSATATVSGGVTPYLYSWSNGASGATASNLAAGNYQVTVTDINGCQQVMSYTINEPALGMSLSLVSDSASCNQGIDGTATAIVAGGTQPYTYSWSMSSDITQTADSLMSGMHHVTVTDAVGCQLTDSIRVLEPTAITVSYVVTQPLCFGDSSASVVATATGGTPGYTLVWAYSGTSILQNIPSGAYALMITDAYGCVKNDTVAVGQPAPLNLSVTTTDATCSSQNNGSAQVTVSGGTMGVNGYSYSWSNGTLSQQNQNLGSGQYIVTVTDSNMCTAQDTAVIITASSLSVSFTDQDPGCFNTTDGWIKAHVSGGVGPYEFVWSTGATTDSIGSLGAGPYTVTVTDSGARRPVKIYQEDFDGSMNWLLNLSTGMNTQQSNLWYHSDSASGVIGSCNNPGSGDSVLYLGTYLQAGLGAQYDPTIESNVSAVSPWISTMGYGSPLSLSFDYKGGTDVLDKASVDVSVDGGQSWINLQTGLGTAVCGSGSEWSLANFLLPATAENNARVQLRFVWSNNNDGTGSTESVAINNVLVTGPRQGGPCEVQKTDTLIAPAAIQISVSSMVNATCTSNNGSIQVQATGGSGSYSYSWNTTPPQNTQQATGLTANTPYTVTVADANGCVKDTVLEISKNNPLLTVDIQRGNATCLSASGWADADVTSTGTMGPYQYTWTPGGQMTDSATNLIGGQQYQLTVKDVNGCQFDTVITIGVNNVDLALTTSSTNNICGNEQGVATVTANAGTAPYTYQWGTEAGTPGNVGQVTGLDGGTYSVVVTDMNGCMSDTTITVNEDLGVIASFTPSTLEDIAPASVSFTNSSTGASNYLWEFGDGNTSTATSPTNEYNAGVFDVVLHAYYGNNNECEDTAKVRIIILDQLQLYIPNVFAPGSSNGQNQAFRVTGRGVIQYEAMIFDRWGKKVFESTVMTEEWNGDGSSAGTYYYIIKVTGTDKKELAPYTGFITLVK